MPRDPRVLFGTLLLVCSSYACAPADTLEPIADPDALGPAVGPDAAPGIGRTDPLIARAVARVDAATSGRYRELVELRVDGLEEPLTTVTEGAFDEVGQRYARRSADGDRFADVQLQVVVDGAAVYAWRSDAFRPELPSGWVGGEALDATEARTGAEAMGLLTDPVALVELLVGVSPLEPDGTEDLGHGLTDRYRTSLHLAHVAERLSDERIDVVGPNVEELQGLLEQVGSSADEPIPTTVWLDDAGALRRYELLVPAAPKADGFRASARVVVELYDYGEHIDIAVPDPAEVGAIG